MEIPADFHRTLDLCAMQRLMQALGAYGFLGLVKGRAHFLAHIPAALASLREVTARIEGLGNLRRLLDTLAMGCKFRLRRDAKDIGRTRVPCYQKSMTPKLETVIIENVTPLIDGGRYPVKRATGEDLLVEADVFMAGHDVVAALLKWRARGAARWHETPMTSIPNGNDRWGGVLSLFENAVYEYTIEGWVDAFRSWQHEFRKKFEGGVQRPAQRDDRRRAPGRSPLRARAEAARRRGCRAPARARGEDREGRAAGGAGDLGALTRNSRG